MQRLWDAGYHRMIIQDTGLQAWGPYQGPGELRQLEFHSNFDGGMKTLKERLTPADLDGVQYLCHIDSDCFLGGTTHFTSLLQAVEDYDFVSHLEQPGIPDSLQTDHLVIPAPEQEFVITEDPYGFKPVPHWENSLTFIARWLWDETPVSALEHTRAWIRLMATRGARFGIHPCEHRLQYTHTGPEWFHFGNLIGHFCNTKNGMLPFRDDSEIDLSRIGFIGWVEEKYGMVYGQDFSTWTARALRKLGENRCRRAWLKLAHNTCMENWERP
jgi:hypothetical protein